MQDIFLNDGDGLVVGNGAVFNLECCDCMLTHKIQVNVVGEEVELILVRDKRRTSQKRRRAKERKERKIPHCHCRSYFERTGKHSYMCPLFVGVG